MNRINPRKLLLSKWTAAQPKHREKHFLVTQLFCDEEGTVLESFASDWSDCEAYRGAVAQWPVSGLDVVG